MRARMWRGLLQDTVSPLGDMVHYYFFILQFVEDFFCRKKEMDQIFVSFHIHTTCRDNFVFQSLFVFSPGWRVGFTTLN
jgi:hypothetical protein